MAGTREPSRSENKPRLILASSSPRRRELLENARIPFRVEVAQIDETVVPGETPQSLTERLAWEKASYVAAKFPGEFVLAADTVVALNDSGREGSYEEILGKPADASDAARMLRLLSGRAHDVTSGVCLIIPLARHIEEEQGGPRHAPSLSTELVSVRTRVTMESLSEPEIAEYVATGEPLDKAGAYAVQGIASRWISNIAGCYYNVVGLPMPQVYRMLRRHGVI